MRTLLTPKQVATALGASEASLKRWCDKGLIPAVRTAGGHRRLPISGVVQFVRERGQTLVRPEVLGLPPATGISDHSFERVRALFRNALEAGDVEQCRQLLLNLYLAGRRAYEICDRVIAPALHEIGDRWSHGDLEIYAERRGIEICVRILNEFRSMLPLPLENAPLAIGAALSGDPYLLPTTMTEITLRELGWRAMSYGVDLPAATLRAALRDVRPRLFWLSVSAVADEARFLEDYASLHEMASIVGAVVVVGGRALNENLRARMDYAAYGDNLAHLASFARTLYDGQTRAGADPTVADEGP